MKPKRLVSLVLCVSLLLALLPTAVLADDSITEQFTLAPGGTYYFDLSEQGVPGILNAALPDSSLKWVPFTYAGTVNAYSLDVSSSGVVDASDNAAASDRSLFVADYNISLIVSWDALDNDDLIFGKDYSPGGVDYKLRSLSTGSFHNEQDGDDQRGTPETNEWDQILNKDESYIKNWDEIFTWGQDTIIDVMTSRAIRGSTSARYWYYTPSTYTGTTLGWRPALEILDPAALGSDGLKTVTYDMDGNGTLGDGSLTSATVVYTGALTLPAITAANGFNNTGSGVGTLGWYDGSTFYTPGTVLDSLASGTTLTAGYEGQEQFTLAPGGTYYFDLSEQGVPGMLNEDLPDSSLKWVPFTYAGTVNAYSRTEEGVSTTESVYVDDRSLFVADYNISHSVSWDNLNGDGLIFGKDYSADGVDYTLRSLSVGSCNNGQSGDDERGTPETNEWDQLRNKDGAFIKRIGGMYSWGQDTGSTGSSYRASRGCYSARYWGFINGSNSNSTLGWRPALEILDPAALGSDGLKTITYDMDGNGTLGSGSLESAAVVYTGALTLPEVKDTNGFNYTETGSGTLGWYDGSTFYTPGTVLDSLPNGTKLTAGYGVVQEQFTLAPGGTYYFDLSDQGIPGTVNTALPDNSLKWVPFTYAGTVNAYSLDASSSGVVDASDNAAASDRSLLVADYNVSHTVSWDELNNADLIFGKPYSVGGVAYKLRSLSVGSDKNEQVGNNIRGTPETNEWDQILNKDEDYINNWNGINSWGQDTSSEGEAGRALRGYWSARTWTSIGSSYGIDTRGWCPALEILDPAALGSDGLKTVTFDMDDNGTLGDGLLETATVVYTGAMTLPEITAENGFAYTGSGTGILGWYDDNGSFYAPGTAPDLAASITLTPGYCTAPTITTDSPLESGTVGTFYSKTLAADGGTPITWTIDSGGLPDGLSLSGNTISGTPTTEGIFNFTVEAENGVGSDTQELSIVVNPALVNYTITAKAGSGGSISPSGAVNVTEGSNQAFTITPNSRYRISSVTVDGVNQGAITTYTFTNVTANHTINATFSRTSGGGGGGGGTPSTPSTPTALDYEAEVKEGNGSETTLPVTLDKDAGTASIAAGSQSFAQGGTVITIPSIPDVSTYSVGVPVPDLSMPDGQGAFTLNTDTGSIIVPSNMLTGVSGISGSKAEISIGQGNRDNLPDDVRAAIGDRPLVQVTLSVDGEQTEWNNPDAPVTVSIPYTPTAEELSDPEHITVWYIDSKGKVVEVPSGKYDPATGMVTFSTTHFSNYAVVYVTKTFDDLGSAVWAKKPIEVLASKGILTGISEKEYNPQTNITRADFLYFLIRTLGLDAKINGNFDDISSDAYYYKEIAIAKKLGITSGTGNNKFSPDTSITRQDMMVLTERALRMLNKLEVQGTASDLDKFADKSLVAAYAVNSVASVVKEGLIVDCGDNVNPLGNTTRAEAAAFLYRIYDKY